MIDRLWILNFGDYRENPELSQIMVDLIEHQTVC